MENNKYIHVKSGQIYTVISENIIECTNNSLECNDMKVLYQNSEGEQFVRSVKEFHERFKPYFIHPKHIEAVLLLRKLRNYINYHFNCVPTEVLDILNGSLIGAVGYDKEIDDVITSGKADENKIK